MSFDTFVGLHVHSEHSMLDGYSSVEQIANRAAALGQLAIALTDHQECGGHVDFEKACKKLDIKPIFGMEGYFVADVTKVKEEKDKSNSHYCVLAETQQGLRNLWTISSLAYIKGFYYRALADWDLLREYKNGLIFTDGCGLANTAKLLTEDNIEEAKIWISKNLELFGENNYFMELHTFQYINPTPEQEEFNARMRKWNHGKVQIAKELGVGLIVVNDAHYSCPEDWDNHALVWALSTNQDQLENSQAASWIMSSEEVTHWMVDKVGIDKNIVEEALSNTVSIAERCNAEIERKPHIPVIVSSKEENLKIFNESIEEGFKSKVIDKGLDIDVYRERVEKDKRLIIQRELYGYFNVVADFCKWAKQDQKMLVSPGRGSAGGSLVAYLMGINEIDPIPYGLFSERFLNEGREDYPDIDLDFPQSRRQEVKDYLANKYGEDKVCSIGSFIRIKAPVAAKDIARSLGISFDDAQQISNIIKKAKVSDSEDAKILWDEIYVDKKDELDPWVKRYPALFAKMRDLVGLIRQAGTHASGVLISDESLIGLLPLRYLPKTEKVTTQFDMYVCAELGFIKFDLLGIRHLDTLTEAYKMIFPHKEFDPQFFYDFKDEYKEPEVWSKVSSGKTNGLFQLETGAMTAVAKRMHPQSEVDIATLISIDRPGVVRAGMLDAYLRRRAGREEVSTPHPLMTEITQDTFGVVVFQEQVIEIVRYLANYSLVEADKVRWMVGKKHQEMMRESKPKFIQRCLKNEKFLSLCDRNPEQQAAEVWANIEASGSYNFNKSHALGYSLVSSWGAWMRHHHFLPYLSSCLITDHKNINKYIRELRKEGFSILPPDINLSEERFTLADNGVRYGLADLKYVGNAAIEQIKEYRPFSSFDDFLSSVDKRSCGKRVVENLIKIGAFDSFGNRGSLLRHYYKYRKINNAYIPNFDDPNIIEMVELEIVGNYITHDPLERYIPMIEDNCLNDPEVIEDLSPGHKFFIGGVITHIKEWNAKNGLMCFLDIEWAEQTHSLTVFADYYPDIKDLLAEGKPIIAHAQKLKRGFMLKQMIRLDQV